jgi:hypothetical protein
MGVATTFEVQSGAAQDRKPFSLWPRNYNQRRHIILGGCVLFLIVWIGKGKTKKSSTILYHHHHHVVVVVVRF